MKNYILTLCILMAGTVGANDLDLIKDFDLDATEYQQQREVNELTEENSETRLKEIILTDDENNVDPELDQKKFIKMASLAGIAVVLFANDREIQDFVQENKNDFTEKVAVFGERFGAGTYSMAYLLSAYVAGNYILGVVKDNDKLKAYALYGMKSVAYATLLTRLGKHLFGRVRPNKTDDPYDFEGPNIKHVSFPSGHTTMAWSFATFLAIAHKDKPIVPILAYSAATIAGLSRIHDNAHWASDVFVGGLIGHFVTKWVMKKFPKFDINGRNCDRSDLCGEDDLPFPKVTRKDINAEEIQSEKDKRFMMIPNFSTDEYGNFKMSFTWIEKSKEENTEILKF
ncbi:MAG: phosphatase PAP2 family protein [Oligoflexia bacterium]|nr:phosphatase PAP2 family protein [Oligoflexia bacterium]